jgi:hypothetical protein
MDIYIQAVFFDMQTRFERTQGIVCPSLSFFHSSHVSSLERTYMKTVDGVFSLIPVGPVLLALLQ